MAIRVSKLLGLNGNDTIYGTAKSEQIFGFCGDDKIYGGGGNDTIYGGIGFDTVYFTQACSNYKIVKVAGGLQITHVKGSKADGSDFVSSDVERIVFGGKIYNSNCLVPRPNANTAAPVAKADTNWVKEDTNIASTGNVLKALAHAGAPAGTFADNADTDADTPILTVKNAGTILGAYGKLVLNADGHYTYTLYTLAEKPSAFAFVQALSPVDAPLVESFIYKVTDGTHVSSSTLKISIFGSDDGVSIGGLQLEGADETVFESNLQASRGPGETDGTSPSVPALTPSGSFTISAPDGIGNLTIGGTQVIASGFVINLNVPITTAFGTVKITAINLSTGVISYTYKLADNTAAHGFGDNGANSVIDNIAIQLTDRDGSHATASLTVRIVDDVPSLHLTQATQPTLVVDESDLAVNATADFSGLFASAYGADGPGSLTYKLGINAGETGLIDTLSGQAVVLSLNGAVVEGRTSGSNLLVFKMTVDGAGHVALDQSRALHHPDAQNPNDSVSLLSSHLVTLTAKITDGDGDTATQTADIGGAFHFKDDAPIAHDDGNTVSENGAVIVTAAAAGVLSNDHVGADQPGTVTAVSGGDIGSEFSGQFGNLTLFADGSYTYVPQASVAAGSVDSFTYTLADADGDTSTATLSFTFGADTNAPTAGVTSARVDEDDLPAGNHDAAPGDDVPSAQPGTLVHDYGADGAGHIKLTGGLEIVNAVTYTYSANATGTELLANDGIHDVFKVILTDSVAGTYTVELLAAIDHPLVDTEDNLTFNIGYDVFDADSVAGVAGHLMLTVDDDSPTAGDACVVLAAEGENDDSEDENQNEIGNQSGYSSDNSSHSSGTESDTLGTAVVYGTLAHSYGADQNGNIALGSVALPTDGGFTQSGSGNQIIISQNNIAILEIDLINPVTGSYKLAQLAAAHGDSGDDDAAFMAFTLNYAVTDGDGDTASGTLTIKLNEPDADDNSGLEDSQNADNSSAPIVLISDDSHSFVFGNGIGTGQPCTCNSELHGPDLTGTPIDASLSEMDMPVCALVPAPLAGVYQNPDGWF